jgi:hypothetical protein
MCVEVCLHTASTRSCRLKNSFSFRPDHATSHAPTGGNRHHYGFCSSITSQLLRVHINISNGFLGYQLDGVVQAAGAAHGLALLYNHTDSAHFINHRPMEYSGVQKRQLW